ncbi:MAG TPA: hypothetical protein VMU77_06970, partial [Acidimicrobiales bacterium]|nr:hypothetical protein [Acidimicrobiales bacterium]
MTSTIDIASNEASIRGKLGIPSEAERVLIFTESSHWDPDWMLTSKGYFRLRVRRNLDQAIAGLIEDPKRVYGVECAFYVRMYWENRPEQRDVMRDLFNQGRLRLMGSGVTTPDTIIPSTEALIRDYLVGQEWFRANGINAEPDIAYFPDSFGHTPAMPSIMRAVGVDKVAVCRIDGAFFLGCETELPKKFPRRGTSAEILSRQEKTQDFVWKGPDGSEILAHWVAFGYGHGELLAHSGITRAAGAPLAVPNRTDSHVSRRIGKYVKQLSRNARTPYMLCPIGFDFSTPIPRLNELIDRYNTNHFGDTGVWATNAGLDDYFNLVNCHRGVLPVLQFDPNPYFSGFYTSRTTVKRRSVQLIDALQAVETSVISGGDMKRINALNEKIAEPWWIAATSNHHDFITGTAPDRVTTKEQLPWLERSLDQLIELAHCGGLDQRNGLKDEGVADNSRLSSLSGNEEILQQGSIEDGGGAVHRERFGSTSASLKWARHGSRIDIEVPGFGTAVFDGDQGGSMVSLVSESGDELLSSGPSLDVVTYRDTGGLWRMGLEYAGGSFDLLHRSSHSRASMEISESSGGGLILRVECLLEGIALTKWIYLNPGRPGGLPPLIRVGVKYTVPKDRTVSMLIRIPQAGDEFVMDVPGGVVGREIRNFFDPTYWSVHSFNHVRDIEGSGTALFVSLPAAAALHSNAHDSKYARLHLGESVTGTALELVLFRNAPKERYLGFLPIVGFPARGHDPGPHRIDTAICFTDAGDWRENRLKLAASSFVSS